jgi:hypothetical protein
MRLSEAIRLGSMLKPQQRGGYLDRHGTCALGAASEALGMAPDLQTQAGRSCVPYLTLSRAYPWLDSLLEHPETHQPMRGYEVVYTCHVPVQSRARSNQKRLTCRLVEAAGQDHVQA